MVAVLSTYAWRLPNELLEDKNMV